MTWDDARDYCHQEGGYLIAPETNEANDYVLSFVDGKAHEQLVVAASTHPVTRIVIDHRLDVTHGVFVKCKSE